MAWWRVAIELNNDCGDMDVNVQLALSNVITDHFPEKVEVEGSSAGHKRVWYPIQYMFSFVLLLQGKEVLVIK